MAQLSLYGSLCSESILYNAWKVVKEKNAAGGIDGITVSYFDENLAENLKELIQELKAGQWKPEPYLRIEIPKKENEKRKLGLLSIKDKVVQQAIKMLIEPRFEKVFLNNSYGYRPQKGHIKAAQRTLNECKKEKSKWALRLDIDNYFDTINHDLLSARIHALVPDEEIVRLIMLSVKMGVVSKNMKWQDTKTGVPQGAVISPLLANLYLQSFDQFVTTRPFPYIRYADDFIILCETKEQAEIMLLEITTFLSARLFLKLNDPIISEVKEGVEFLGIVINKTGFSISQKKNLELKERIQSIEIHSEGIISRSRQTWNAICNYYGKLISQSTLQNLDNILYDKLKQTVEIGYKRWPNKAVLARILLEIDFLSEEYQLKRKQIHRDLIDCYSVMKGLDEGIRSTGCNPLLGIYSQVTV